MSESPTAKWIHCQEVKSGKYFWLHSETHDVRHNDPSDTNEAENGKLSITRRQLQKTKSITPPPTIHGSDSYNHKKSKHKNKDKFLKPKPHKWSLNKKSKRAQTDGQIEWTMPAHSKLTQTQSQHTLLPNYKIVNNNGYHSTHNRDRAKSSIKPNDSSTEVYNFETLTKTEKPFKSKYDIEPCNDIGDVLLELLNYPVLDINECIDSNEYIRSEINSFLLYRFQSISESIHTLKQFKPPTNDTHKQMIYFRNIQYPQYKRDTNLKIQQIIKQNVYSTQIPYLRIRVPIQISNDIFGTQIKSKTNGKLSKLLFDRNERKNNEIFNIELSKENILNTTVQQFFHKIVKQCSAMTNDAQIRDKFTKGEWNKLAIKCNGMEEYIFYSTDMNDIITNYECIRYALSHQLDRMDSNKCYLTLVFLSDFNAKIGKLKMKYTQYKEYIEIYKKYIENICIVKQQFNGNYPWINAINGQFCEGNIRPNNEAITEWKQNYDTQYGDNNIIFLHNYKCAFEYTIHSIINYQKLPRFIANRQKYASIIISFELQIGNISYENEIWLTPPKSIQNNAQNKIVFKKAIYKSKHLKINTFPREVILSIIVFGIPHNTKDSDIYSVIYSAKSYPSNNDQKLLPKWYPSDNDNASPNGSDKVWNTHNYTRHRQYSYGSVEEETKNGENAMNNDCTFYNAFNKCDALGYVRIPLIDNFHCYKQGTFTFNLWDIPPWTQSKHSPRDPFGHHLLWRFIKPCSAPPNINHKNQNNTSHQCQICITIGPNPENNPNFKPPKVIAPLFNTIIGSESEIESVVGKPKNNFTANDFKKWDTIIRRDPLTPLRDSEKYLIWISRDKLCRTKPSALPIFLSCIDWRNPYFRSEAYKYLYKWKVNAQNSQNLTELLCNWRYFPDNRLKHYVIVTHLNGLSDIKIARLLLQMVQIIKLEPQNYSLLSSFLVRRALKSVTLIGHYMYWYLKSEIEIDHSNYVRFSLILEDFLLHCFNYPFSLYVQKRIVNGLKSLSLIIQKGKKNKQPNTELKLRMHHILKRINKSINNLLIVDSENGISIPLSPKYKFKQLNIDKCKFMSSAQAPLWLEYTNSCAYENMTHETYTKVLFKNGDDLRQDLLTLQIMDSMNELWLVSGYCMRFRIYSVIITGLNCGFIEIVTNARTFDDLSVHLGGGVVSGPKNETVHVKYLKSVHKNVKKGIEMAQDRYLRSCVGYCIASWIIGIGDRHSDNIMVHECGDLFHIDFGHFLGNFKVKKLEISKKVTFEWKRERSPFVFLPTMKYCIKYDFDKMKPGVKDDKRNVNYQRFIELCTTALDAIKRKQRHLINLMVLMIPSQMPELLCASDIVYMRDQITAIKIENYDNIRKYVEQQFDKSFNDWSRSLDHIAHAWKHSK